MKFIQIIIFFTFIFSESLEIDATNWDEWIYINLSLALINGIGVVDPGDFPEDNLGWDIACKRYHFRTNSGLSGSGNGGAYVDSLNTWNSVLYNGLFEVPENSYFERDTVVNTFYEIDGDEHVFGLPGIANPSLETWGWIDIDNEYSMNYTDHQFIVRTGTGDKFYKLWAVNYYNQNGSSGNITIYFDEIAPCSIPAGHDDCGECGGNNLSCSGCTDELSCNYDVMAFINQGCEYPIDNYDCAGTCIQYDDDDDGICDDDDICPNNYDPYQNDNDSDGFADACIDNDDDDDGLVDCWNFAMGEYPNTIYFDENDELIYQDDIVASVESGACGDYELALDEASIPRQFELFQNYPNPFNPSTTIEYFLMNPSYVTISIFDINGKNIFMLERSFKYSGNHTVEWNGLDGKNQKMPSGLYMYRLTANGLEIDKKKMLLLY